MIFSLESVGLDVVVVEPSEFVVVVGMSMIAFNVGIPVEMINPEVMVSLALINPSPLVSMT